MFQCGEVDGDAEHGGHGKAATLAISGQLARCASASSTSPAASMKAATISSSRSARYQAGSRRYIG
jgi:hypothetical protein